MCPVSNISEERFFKFLGALGRFSPHTDTFLNVIKERVLPLDTWLERYEGLHSCLECT